MSVNIKSGDSSDLLKVNTGGAASAVLYDHDGNPISLSEGEAVASNQGYLIQGVENDGIIVPMRGDRYGSIGLATGNVLLHEAALAATVNASKWVSSISGMTITQAIATGVLLNANSTLTANAYAILTSGKSFMRHPRQPLEFRARAAITPKANAIVELGLGNPATNTVQIGTGAFFRSSGPTNIRPVVAYNAGDVVTGDPFDMTAYVGSNLIFTVVLDDNVAVFRIADAQTGTVLNRQQLRIPSSGAKVMSIAAIHAFGRVYNSASTPLTAAQLNIGEAVVVGLDNAAAFTPSLAAAVNFEDGSSLPATGLLATTFANSAAPADAALSNTAAGYSTLGGLFSFVAVAGAATDYALFNYVPTKDFVCTGLRVDAFNVGAAVATTPSLLVWGLGHDGATVNLSSGAHRRVACGAQSFPIGAAVGATADRPVDCDIEPSVTRASRSLTVILRMPVGTATASQKIQGVVNVKGYHL